MPNPSVGSQPACAERFSVSGGDDDCWFFYDGVSLHDSHGVVLWTSGKLVGPTM
jgi:hypothetical protein